MTSGELWLVAYIDKFRETLYVYFVDINLLQY
jgi:hypothetical protein